DRNATPRPAPRVTTKPPFGGGANAASARSISSAWGVLTGTPSPLRNGNDGKKVASRPLRGISKHRHSREAWCDLFEQFQPFHANTKFVRHESGGVAARPR